MPLHLLNYTYKHILQSRFANDSLSLFMFVRKQTSSNDDSSYNVVSAIVRRMHEFGVSFDGFFRFFFVVSFISLVHILRKDKQASILKTRNAHIVGDI